jgi:hypothetical protein
VSHRLFVLQLLNLHSIATLGIMILSIMDLTILLSINDTQKKNWMSLCWVSHISYCYTECHFVIKILANLQKSIFSSKFKFNYDYLFNWCNLKTRKWSVKWQNFSLTSVKYWSALKYLIWYVFSLSFRLYSKDYCRSKCTH